ncbi:MAG: hypothetical protein LBC58_04070 [Clostridiales Family XIII bacterium]|jgi:hypothetical protein|nr:hypothetical protein [Clostridiales Family XIII bacterium]
MKIDIPDDFGDMTVGDLLAAFAGEDKLDAVRARVCEELCVRISATVLRADLAGIIEREGAQVLQDSLPGPLAALLGGGAMSGVSKRMEAAVQKQLLENGREILIPLIAEELRELEKEPVNNLLKLWNTED